MGMRLDEFSCQPRKLVRINESFVSVVGVKDSIFKDRDTFAPQVVNVVMDICGS